jgi:hypothetical protein
MAIITILEKTLSILLILKIMKLWELKGIYWIEADTLIIGQLNKMSLQKYFISKLNDKELHLQIVIPKENSISENKIIFKRE